MTENATNEFSEATTMSKAKIFNSTHFNELHSQAWQLFLKTPWQFLLLFVISYGIPELYSKPGFSKVLVFAVSIFFQFFGFTAIILLAKANYRNVSTNMANILQFAMLNMLKYTLATLAIGAISFGGILLLIVPGVFWFYCYCLAQYLVVIDDIDLKTALKKSRAYMEGIKWQLAKTQLIIGLAYFVITYTVALFVAGFQLNEIQAIATKVSRIPGPLVGGYLAIFMTTLALRAHRSNSTD